MILGEMPWEVGDQSGETDQTFKIGPWATALGHTALESTSKCSFTYVNSALSADSALSGLRSLRP
ncbi:MAG TPA: hypothetical protein DIU04_19000 [Pseudomonas sp.]|nr:hypothetical protein [Pseudomonas sp.]